MVQLRMRPGQGLGGSPASMDRISRMELSTEPMAWKTMKPMLASRPNWMPAMTIRARVMPGARPAWRLPPEVQTVWKRRPPFQGLRLSRKAPQPCPPPDRP